jgi:group II intron reverse transcriptase/maturase
MNIKMNMRLLRPDSVDETDNITVSEQRAVSLKNVSCEIGRPAATAVKTAGQRPENWVRGFQRKLYRAAKESPQRQFGILYDKICMSSTLQVAWKRVSANKGSAGVDQETINEIKEKGVEKFLNELQNELLEEKYCPNKIKRVYIEKSNGSKRPLGIPTVKDRVAQMAMKLITEPLFEADFLDCSHGFRPKRDNKEAAQKTHKLSNTHKWAVDVDLKGYFDTIPHEELINLLRRRIIDKKVLALFRKWLKAPVVEDGQTKASDIGAPQGGVLSPLLSNIYLHEIDKLWHENKTVKLVRFADDMVFMCRSKRQAEWVMEKLRSQLEEMKLTLNEDKTEIKHVGEGFEFVGFKYRETYSTRQKRLVRTKYPRAKSMKKIRSSIKETLKSLPLGMTLREVIGRINPKLRGWANYFKIGNSYGAGWKLHRYVCDQLRLFWRRRKQLKRINGCRKWKNAYYNENGLLYIPELLRRKTNAAI